MFVGLWLVLMRDMLRLIEPHALVDVELTSPQLGLSEVGLSFFSPAIRIYLLDNILHLGREGIGDSISLQLHELHKHIQLPF